MSWMLQDITFCASESCPIKEYCFRKVGPLPGVVHSYSDFSEHCNHQNVFEMFIQANKELRKRYKYRNAKKEGTVC